MSETWHGTLGGYTNHNCRCDPCRQAAREYHRTRRVPCLKCGAPVYRRAHNAERFCVKCYAESKTIPLEERHGTETGYSKGCRCEACTRAMTEARRVRRGLDPEATREYYREYQRRRRWEQKTPLQRATARVRPESEGAAPK